MQLFGLTLARTKSLEVRAAEALDAYVKQIPLAPLSGRSGGWWPLVREPYAGAWQRNDEVSADSVLSFGAIFACTRLISTDIAKLNLRLVEQTADGIWEETESAAFSPVLRKPNHFQNTQKFIQSWVTSKLNSGATYALKVRDARRIVTALYVLDPSLVTPLVAENGDVYYELRRDQLSRLGQNKVTVPASEIIHDRGPCLWHPLIGVTPIYACGMAALQGQAIQGNSNKIFSNGAFPGALLIAPTQITNEQAARLKDIFETNYTGDNFGKVAVLGNNLKYEQIKYNAVDLQLIEQLNWTGANVCTAYGVPSYLVGIGPAPPYANAEPLIQQYYSGCLQDHIISIERCLDEGLELPKPYGTEFDVDDLIWMDPAARTKAAQDSIGSGGMSPNEARKRFLGLPPVKGGESPLVQQQYYSLGALAERDANKPFSKPAPAATAQAPDQQDSELANVASFQSALHKKALEVGLYEA